MNHLLRIDTREPRHCWILEPDRESDHVVLPSYRTMLERVDGLIDVGVAVIVVDVVVVRLGTSGIQDINQPSLPNSNYPTCPRRQHLERYWRFPKGPIPRYFGHSVQTKLAESRLDSSVDTTRRWTVVEQSPTRFVVYHDMLAKQNGNDDIFLLCPAPSGSNCVAHMDILFEIVNNALQYCTAPGGGGDAVGGVRAWTMARWDDGDCDGLGSIARSLASRSTSKGREGKKQVNPHFCITEDNDDDGDDAMSSLRPSRRSSTEKLLSPSIYGVTILSSNPKYLF
ncbi:hypothetical protein BU24DRAFT_413818 [Aaosphaeria arxii CBS 175.79]|uniref:Uncharacterized protein n=1 Tax=Aaosphaeria arxii CBS 175.79 TaxID=1450172 RepID=A0A6A5XE12_9PLEO|nr:uncharacterized protein BU24DRAFT_413818 [Aaosphaeria arxii CBS 175.79]KAF2011139.1 hypothetical protein BU24DRAFT_413818 [Aaosphaeria arxii CBS 175.79]